MAIRTAHESQMLQLVFSHDGCCDSVKCSSVLCATVSPSPLLPTHQHQQQQFSLTVLHYASAPGCLAFRGWFYQPHASLRWIWWHQFFLCPSYSVQSYYVEMKNSCLSDVHRHFLCHHCDRTSPEATDKTWPQTKVYVHVRATHTLTHTLTLTLNDWVIYWLRRSLFSTVCSWVQWRLNANSQLLPLCFSSCARALYPVKVSLI